MKHNFGSNDDSSDLELHELHPGTQIAMSFICRRIAIDVLTNVQHKGLTDPKGFVYARSNGSSCRCTAPRHIDLTSIVIDEMSTMVETISRQSCWASCHLRLCARAALVASQLREFRPMQTRDCRHAEVE